MLTDADKKWVQEEVTQAVLKGTKELLDGVVMPGFMMIDRQFTEVNNRLDKLDGRMDTMENRMDSLETKIDIVDRKVTRIADHHGDILDKHTKKINRLETAVL